MLHDWDYPLYTKKTCLKRSWWLLLYALLGNRILPKMPKWLKDEKVEMAKATVLIDKLHNVESIFAITNEVKAAFPNICSELAEMNARIIHHWHEKERVKGINEWKARGRWDSSIIPRDRIYLDYDKRFMRGVAVKPEDNSFVVWHIDHFPFNMAQYLGFLGRLKKEWNTE